MYRLTFTCCTAGAAPSRPSTETSLAGAFERMLQMGGLGGAATDSFTHGKSLHMRISPLCPIARCVVLRWVRIESCVLGRDVALLLMLPLGLVCI